MALHIFARLDSASLASCLYTQSVGNSALSRLLRNISSRPSVRKMERGIARQQPLSEKGVPVQEASAQHGCSFVLQFRTLPLGANTIHCQSAVGSVGLLVFGVPLASCCPSSRSRWLSCLVPRQTRSITHSHITVPMMCDCHAAQTGAFSVSQLVYLLCDRSRT